MIVYLYVIFNDTKNSILAQVDRASLKIGHSIVVFLSLVNVFISVIIPNDKNIVQVHLSSLKILTQKRKTFEFHKVGIDKIIQDEI